MSEKGNLMKISRLLAGIALFATVCLAQTTYTYDSGGHLTRANYGASGSIVYSYDAAGHLIGRNLVTGTAGTISVVTTASTPTPAGVSQTAWVHIQATNLVPATTPAAGVVWSTAPDFAQGKMPTMLNGISVTIDSKPAYIYFFCSKATSTVCSQDQINVLSPLDSATGPVQVVVTNNGLATPPFTVTMHALVPALFTFDGSHVVATHVNGSLIGPTTLYPGASTPAAAGESIVVYASGFGIPSGAAIIPGASSQSGSFAPLPVCSIGGTNAPLAFAGLISPGLVQLNISVPTNAASADDAIACTVSGSATPAGNVLTVQ